MDTNTQTQSSGKKSFTRFFPHIARVLMGLAFLAFGIMNVLMVLGVMKAPGNIPDDIMKVNEALMTAGYMYVVMVTMLLVGLLLLINRFVPLALALIAPILVGILVFHIRMQPAGIGPGAFLSLLELYLVWSYRSCYHPMLKPNLKPDSNR